MSPVYSYTDWHAFCDVEGCDWSIGDKGEFNLYRQANHFLEEHMRLKHPIDKSAEGAK